MEQLEINQYIRFNQNGNTGAITTTVGRAAVVAVAQEGQMAFVYHRISILCRNLNCNSVWTKQVAIAAARWVALFHLPGNGSIAF